MSLLDRLAESAAGEMYLPTEALGVVVAQPVLQEGSTTKFSQRVLVTR